MKNTELFAYYEETMPEAAMPAVNGELSEAELSEIAGGCWFKLCKSCREEKRRAKEEKKKTPWYIRLIRRESKKYESLLNSL